MNMDKNFEAYITPEEAWRISKNGATINKLFMVSDCYNKAYAEENKSSNDRLWCDAVALCTVYIMGYISGARAVRRKNNITACSKKRG